MYFFSFKRLFNIKISEEKTHLSPLVRLFTNYGIKTHEYFQDLAVIPIVTSPQGLQN